MAATRFERTSRCHTTTRQVAVTVLGVLVGLGMPVVALAQGALTGDWGGARSDLSEHGLGFELAYVQDVFANVHGGMQRGVRTLLDVDLVVAVDMQRLVGWSGARFYFYGLGTAGGDPSAQLVGDVQGIDNIEAPNAVQLYEAWYEQSFLDERIALLVGLHDLNADFDSLETSSLFLNPSHGISPAYAQTGEAGPSIFPTTALAARLTLAPVKFVYLKAAVFDGVAGDPGSSNPNGVHVVLDQDDGVLIADEVGLLPAELWDGVANGKLGIGSWYYTKDRQLGLYALGEYPLYREDPNDADEPPIEPEQGLSAFARFGVADPDLNAIHYFVGAGVTYAGLFPRRDDDVVGLGFAMVLLGDEGRELDLELSYCAQLFSWLSLQPDVQLVINPGGDAAAETAIATGARLGVSL